MKTRTERQLSSSGRGCLLVAMALLAMGVAFVLSSPEMGVQARYQSPGSPLSPVSPVLTQPLQTPARTPTILDITPTPTSELPGPLDTGSSPGTGLATATLVVGGIVLVGLIVGAALLLMRGQPRDESIS